VLPTSHTREQLTNKIFNSPASQVEQAILQQQPLTNTTLAALTADLATLLGINKTAAMALLGVSPSRKTRNPNLDADILDRALMALNLFARVASIIGEEAARAWLQKPKRALDGATPLELLPTRLGLSRLDGLLTALEDGAYL
jgi:hypothetical protein